MALEQAEIEKRLLEAERRLAQATAALEDHDGRIFSQSGQGLKTSSERLEIQMALDTAESEVAGYKLDLLKLADRHHERQGVLLTEQERVQQERREFWFRRFHLSMGLAHGAGLAAITSKMFDAGVPAASVAGTWWAMFNFAAGLILAGAIPISLYFDRSRVAWFLAGLSAVFFIGALGVALAAALDKADPVWVMG